MKFRRQKWFIDISFISTNMERDAIEKFLAAIEKPYDFAAQSRIFEQRKRKTCSGSTKVITFAANAFQI